MSLNLERFIEIYEFARRAHGNQKRKTGEPYITHPVAVSEIARDYGADESTIYACLLHDVVEDTPVLLEEIERRFGNDVAYLVDGVTEIKEDELATFLKVRGYAIPDKRVALIKLADRIHNILNPINNLKWRENYSKSTKFYIELGRELGFDEMASELEELNESFVK